LNRLTGSAMQVRTTHSTEQAWLAAIVAHSQDAIIAKDLRPRVAFTRKL